MHRSKFMTQHADDLAKMLGQGGLATLAAITSFQQELEWGLRVASLSLAIIASCATIWSIWRKNRKNNDPD